MDKSQYGTSSHAEGAKFDPLQSPQLITYKMSFLLVHKDPILRLPKNYFKLKKGTCWSSNSL